MMKRLAPKSWFLSSAVCLTGVVASLLFIACGEQAELHREHEGHDHSAAHAGHGHAHVAPHGGAAVVLGDELYHLEFVLDTDSNLMHCYVLDGHMEQFVRIAEESFWVAGPDGTRWEFKAVPSRATGETVGDTSHFQAEMGSDWGNQEPSFSASVEAITIKQNRFENVSFRYPEGNENVE